jgi:hypothetical protein
MQSKVSLENIPWICVEDVLEITTSLLVSKSIGDLTKKHITLKQKKLYVKITKNFSKL